MKRNKSSKRKGRGRTPVSSSLSDSSAYSGQQKFTATLPMSPTLLTTTVTTGVIASSISLSTAGILNFASRFGGTFDEYRIISARVRIRAVSASTGVSVMMFDEKSNAAPTAADSQERMGLRNANTNAKPNPPLMTWRARDLLDLQYTAIGSSTNPVYIKTYTDAATWGAPIAVTNLWIIEPELRVEFRGIKST